MKKQLFSLVLLAVILLSIGGTGLQIIWYSQTPHAGSLAASDLWSLQRTSPNRYFYSTLSELKTFIGAGTPGTPGANGTNGLNGLSVTNANIAYITNLYTDRAWITNLYANNGWITNLYSDQAWITNLYANNGWITNLYSDNAWITNLHVINGFFDNITVTNGITNFSLIPNTILKADAGRRVTSIANGTGALTNNGSGTFGWFSLSSIPVSFTNLDTVYVSTAGNDATAVRGDWTHPALTYTGALAIAQSGDTIRFGQGTFDTRLNANFPIVQTNLTILGVGAAGTMLTFSNTASGTAFICMTNGSFYVADLTITNKNYSTSDIHYPVYFSGGPIAATFHNVTVWGDSDGFYGGGNNIDLALESCYVNTRYDNINFGGAYTGTGLTIKNSTLVATNHNSGDEARNVVVRTDKPLNISGSVLVVDNGNQTDAVNVNCTAAMLVKLSGNIFYCTTNGYLINAGTTIEEGDLINPVSNNNFTNQTVLVQQVAYLTNTGTMAPNFAHGYDAITTNASFTFLDPINTQASGKYVETTVKLVENSSGSAIVATPFANCIVISNSYMGVGANGATWFTFVRYGTQKTNVYSNAETH